MASKHTPGPWVYRTDDACDWGWVSTADGEFIAQAKDPRANDGATLNAHRAARTDPWEANARLIAAAPDLLEVCEALNVLRTHFDEATSGNQADAYYTFVKGEDALWAKLRAALAKAEGV